MNTYNRFARYYDELMDDVNYEKWFKYLEEIFKKENIVPKDILEMACGTGNLTHFLCQKDYKITCFDLSNDMLSIAYNKLLKYNNVSILNQNMINFEISKKFDVIICVCDSINYIIDEKELLNTFKNVYFHLNNGGLFIFDINSYYKLSHIIGNNIFVEDRENIFYTWQNYFDENRKLCEFYLTFFIKNDNDKYVRFDEQHVERAYFLEEIKEILMSVNFEKVSYYDCFSFSKPNNDSQRINFVCKR